MIVGAEMPSSCLQENGESERERESQIASEEPEFTTENGEQISIDQLLVRDSIIDTEAATVRLEEANETKEPKKKKKSFIWNLIFFIINIVFMFFVVRALINETSGASLGEILAQQGNKLYWLLGALACFIGFYVVNTLSMSVFLKSTTGKRRFWLSLKVTILGKYYDDITPMAAGGQPSQILNLIKGGVTPGVATSIPIIKMIISQLVRWFLIVIIYIFLVPLIPAESGLMNLLIVLLKILGIVGIIITTFVNMGFLFLGSSKIFGKKIAKWAIRIGYRLKIVKNYRKSYDKFIRQVIEYQSSMKFLAQNKSVLFKSIFYTVADFILFCSMGFFTSMAFTQTVTIENFASGLWLWLVSLARYQVVDMASTIMILPGGTGVKEIAFLIMYNVFFKNTDTVAWSFLSWRMFDYYFFLIVGFVFIIVRFIIGLCKNSKKKKLKNAEVAEIAQNAKIKQEWLKTKL